MRYRIREVVEEGDYIIIRFRTKVNHEMLVPRKIVGEDGREVDAKDIVEDLVESYLDHYEKSYPSTAIGENVLDRVRDWIKRLLGI